MGASSTSSARWTCSQPRSSRKPGGQRRPLQLRLQRREQQVAHQGRLARTADPGHRISRPSGNSTLTSRRLCRRAPDQRSRSPSSGRRGQGGRCAVAAQPAAGDRGLDPGDRGRRAGGDDAPALGAGARPQIDQVVGGADQRLLVLHHHHRVAPVAQAEQRPGQRLAVARVQAHRRLVQHVADPAQVRRQLGHDADALALAGRQGVGAAIQRQVAQAQILQHAQAPLQLGHHRLLQLGGQPAQVAQPARAPARTRQRRHLADRAARPPSPPAPRAAAGSPGSRGSACRRGWTPGPRLHCRHRPRPAAPRAPRRSRRPRTSG